MLSMPVQSVTESFDVCLSGTIKRWNHHRGLMTHGSKSKRQHGSIGMSATPSRVLPGLKMAGHMGAERVKIRKLEVSFWQAFVIGQTTVTHVCAVVIHICLIADDDSMNCAPTHSEEAPVHLKYLSFTLL